MSKSLPPREAKLRSDATKALGRAMGRTDAAFRAVLYNRRRLALDRITSAEFALAKAGMAIDEWFAEEERARMRKRR